MDLSIIIISYNTKKLTVDCIKSVISKTKGIKFELIVIDNASTDGSVTLISKFLKSYAGLNFKIIKNNTNSGFGKANNQGIKIAKGDYILLLNSDTVVHDNVTGEMIRWLREHKRIGIASCSLVNKDTSIQGTGGYFPTLMRVFSWMIIQDFPLIDKLIKPFHPMKSLSFSKGDSFFMDAKELDWVTGAFLMVNRKVIDDVGYFDENYFMYTEEVDFCYRAKHSGWKIFYNPEWYITHYGGASGSTWSNVIPEYDGVKRFYKKFYPRWQYPLLRLLLQVGSLGRIIVFGIIKGKEAAYVYVKAFKSA